MPSFSFLHLPGSHGRLVASVIFVATAGVAVWVALPGSGSSAQRAQTAVADRGTIVVSVNGSGLVSAYGSSGAAVAAPSKSAPAVPSSGATVGVQVFPQTSGQVVKVFVLPGQRVRAGEPIAQLGDPTATSVLLQAQINVQTAQLAFAGNPPSGQELAAAQLAIGVARKKLRMLGAPPKQAAMIQARLDLANARLAFETLRRAPVPPSRAALAAARLAITLAQQKLAGVYQPPGQAALLAAQLAVSQAHAKLDALVASPAGPLSSELRAAELALVLAERQLAALTNPNQVDEAAAQLAVAQAQAALDALHAKPPPTDPAALTAAEQELALATQSLAALTAPPATQLAVTAAQRDLHDANTALAKLQSSASPDPAALVAAREAVTQVSQRLSELVASPQRAALSQARLDLKNARLAYQNLRRASVPPSRTAFVAAALAVRLSHEKLAQLAAPPDPAARAQARLDLANAQLGLQALQRRGVPISPGELALDQLKLQAARASLRLASLHEAWLTVRAPVAGTVTSVAAASGAQADPTVALATVADLAHLSVTVNMSEFDVANMKAGNQATVNIAALGGTALPAQVISVAPVGVSNSGVIQFPVTVALLKLAKGLRPGMLASVDVVTAERKGVVRVPLAAIGSVAAGENAGQTTVTVLSSGKSLIRFVDLGLAGATYVQVLRGVKPGERLVLPQLATGGSGVAGTNSPAGIGVPPASQDQGNQGGGGG